MKKPYRVVYTEVLVYEFDVEAENEQDAEAVFNQMVADDEIDFDDPEIESACITKVTPI